MLKDDKIRELVATAYVMGYQFGLLVDTKATTGARYSQLTRLRVEDLQIDDPERPRLMMPKSGKGGDRRRVEKRSQRYSVPITSELAAKLQLAAKGRNGMHRYYYKTMIRRGPTSWAEVTHVGSADLLLCRARSLKCRCTHYGTPASLACYCSGARLVLWRTCISTRSGLSRRTIRRTSPNIPMTSHGQRCCDPSRRAETTWSNWRDENKPRVCNC